MLHTAHGLSADLVGRLKLSPDIDRMSDDAFQEFVQALNVAQSIKDELLRTQAKGGACTTKRLVGLS